ncbi:hypothetical protein J4402_01300 [Candidatus Pacearchaeota archaeon]|nr:hypothetical protein [Candidatus Pacearchaeota archaeon]
MNKGKKDEWEEEFEKWRKESQKKAAKPAEFHEIYSSQIKEETREKISGVEKSINKKWIVLGSIVLVLAAVLIISFATTPPVEAKFKDIDVIVKDTTGLPGDIYYKGTNLFTLTGWESKLEYDGKEDRLFGKESYKELVFDENGEAYTVISLDKEIRLEPLTTNPEEVTRIGWFTDLEKITVNEETSWDEKKVDVLLGSGEIEGAGFDYNFYKKKPYFKIKFNADENEKLGDFAYGFTMKGYDVLLENGTWLKNDNEVVEIEQTPEIILNKSGSATTDISDELRENVLNKINVNQKVTTRSGSASDVSDSKYEIFYNPEEEKAIIVYSPESAQFKNSFLWNVFWVYTPYDDGYAPVYFIVVEEPELLHGGNDWYIESEQYAGSVNDYISKVVGEIG